MNEWTPDSSADRGDADPAVREALARAYSGSDEYLRAVVALCTARLILPTVEAPDDAEPGVSKEDDHDHGDRQESSGPAMAAVLLRSGDGQKGVAVFTGYDAMRAWRPDARPVRCSLDDVAATVAETRSQVILVDIAGPHPLVIEGDLVEQLAAGHRLVELDDGFGWMYVQDPQS